MSPVVLKQIQDQGCFLMILFFKQICPARLHLVDDYVLPTKKRARIAAGPFLFQKTGFLELAAQCDAIGPRFGKELREDLATAWILWIHKWR